MEYVCMMRRLFASPFTLFVAEWLELCWDGGNQKVLQANASC